MKYIEIERFGGPEVMQLKEGPTPNIGDREVLVDIKFAGVNFMDTLFRSGSAGATLPFRPGMEFSGVVAATGKNVSNIKAGDHVVARTLSGGAYATQIVLPAEGVIPIPKELPLETACAVFVQGVVGYFLWQQSQVKSGDVVLISAAGGGIGGLVTQMAKQAGAKVIGLASSGQHEQVIDNGADHAIDYTHPGWSQRVSELTDGKGADVFIDSIGELNGEGLASLAEYGRWVIFGVRSESSNNQLGVEQLWGIITKNISLRGYNAEAFFHNAPQALKELTHLFSSGKLKVPTTRYPLTDAARVHALFEDRKTTGKVVFEI